MPAALKKSYLAPLYTGLEMLKNGFLFDKRYNGRSKRISRPVVIVFTNSLPDKRVQMAPDRWQIWYITPQKTMVKYDPEIHPINPETLP